MKPKKPDTIGPENGHDELEQRHELGFPGEPRMVPPEDRKTPVAPPDPPVTASQVVEILTVQLAPVKAQVRDMHAMIMGVEMPDGSVKGGIGKALHDVNNSAVILSEATQVIEDQFVGFVEPGQGRRSLPDRIAAAVAERFIAIYQEEIRGLTARVAALEAEGRPSVNGSGD